MEKSTEEVTKLGRQFKLELEEAENRYNISLKEMQESTTNERRLLLEEGERKLSILHKRERECDSERESLRREVVRLRELE
jgi:hypothetical protein